MTPSFAATRLVRGLSLLALAAALPASAQENDFAQECAPVPVHRFLNTANGTHFLTTHLPQKEFLQSYRADLRYEGVAYHAFATKAINSVGVHRIYSGTLGVHFYTTSSSEKDKFIRDYPGATYEGIDHYVPQGMGGGAIEIGRSVSAARNAGWVYARSAAEQQQYSQGNWKSDGVAFYAFPSTMAASALPKSRCEPGPIHRFIGTVNVATFMTPSEAEKKFLEGFRADLKYQGVAFYAHGPGASTPGVFRLYSPTADTHFYTTLESERAAFAATGATNEGLNFSIQPSTKTLAADLGKLFRLKHPGTRRYLYAISESERDSWIKQYGFKDDGVFMTCLKSSKPGTTGGNEAPSVALTVPAYVSSNPANVVLKANASDKDGSIALVEFFNGPVKLGEIKAAPFDFAWNNVAPGTYSLVAVAVDDKGARSSSAAVSLAVAAPAVQYTTQQKDAARFLTQATFGIKSTTEVDQLVARGYDSWLSEQFAINAASHIAYIDAAKARETKSKEEHAYEAIWSQWLNEPGQLRARTSFALSEIFVISNIAPDLETDAMASYMDLLNRNAFGNYRTLLEEVTLHPTMGYYLNMQGSKKEDLVKGTHPNENYAREVLQLFSIGLYQLNPDGSRVIGADGKPVSNYNEDVVKGFARAFSGWNFAGNNTNDPKIFDPAKENWREPMLPWEMWHETGTKTLLNGVTLPAGQNARKDMKDALDSIFNHPNVGPHIGRQLIQRLVTSNPSPAYIGRISAVFNNNGQGVRGDLKAVIRAILMDVDARNLVKLTDLTWGKQREPVIRFANFLRAFNATSPSGRNKIWYLDSADEGLGQSPLLSPSVFNFFSPNYRQPGPLAQANLVAPEFQITTETSMVGQLNFFAHLIKNGYYGSGDTRLTMNLAIQNALSSDPAALADQLNLLLLNGSMSESLRGTLAATIAQLKITKTGSGSVTDRVKAALIMLSLSPEYAIQK